jgi:DivIVA domain-containing protein
VTFFQLLIVLALIAGVVAMAAGKVRGGLPEPTSTRPEVDLPAQDIGTRDVDAIRFSVGFRGYRMDEVDEVLDRLGLELGAREEELRELRERIAGGPESVSSTPLASAAPSASAAPPAPAAPSGDPELLAD